MDSPISFWLTLIFGLGLPIFPVLWRKRQRPVRGRAAWAAWILVCGIIDIVHREEEPNRILIGWSLQRVANDVRDIATKCTDVLAGVFEDIIVSNETPKIEVLRAIPDSQQVGTINSNLAAENCTFGANEGVKGVSRQREREIRRERIVPKLEVQIGGEVNGLAAAAIFVNWPDAPPESIFVIQIPVPIEAEILRINEGSLQFHEGGFGYIGAPFSLGNRRPGIA